jgi:purine catabolism regulator
MESDFGLSMKEVLALDAFRDAKVVGGNEGLHQTVRSVNVMEVPDIFEWIQPGELLITAGYSIRDNPEAQLALIPKLAGKQLAGLAIKPQRYLGKIPQAMIEQANAYKFPLVELPADVSFSDLISPVLRGIVNQQNRYLSHSLQVHQKFMEIVAHGGTIKDMADCLAQLAGNPVMIYDAVHNRLERDAGQWSGEMLAAATDFARANLGGMPEQTCRCRLECPCGGVDILATPIIKDHAIYGRVLVLEANKPLSGTDVQTAERLAAVAALEIVNLLAFDQIERRYANEFMDQILNARIDDEWIARAKLFGWDLDKSYFAILLQTENAAAADGEADEKHQMLMNGRIVKGLTQHYRAKKRAIIAGTKGNHIVLFLETQYLDRMAARREALKQAESIRKELQAMIKGGTITLGLGRHHPGVGGFQRSYDDARKSLLIGAEIGLGGKDIHFDDLGVYRLLVLLEKREEMKAYLQDYVTPLLAYDDEKNTELFKTLTMYFKYRGNIRKISQALFTHYNTILYRIERIQEITGLNLDENEDRINLEIALKLHTLLERS